MKYGLSVLLCLLGFFTGYAQFAFELTIDRAMRVGNTDQFAISGTVLSGRLEKNKTYYLEDGNKFVVENIISSKTATSVPVANEKEIVSVAATCKNFEPGHGDVLRGITTKPTYSSYLPYGGRKLLPEGMLSCRINGKLYSAKAVSKPVMIREANILDMFFTAQDESVIWLQLNGFSEIEDVPHNTKSDTSEKNHSLVCKVAYMPKGYRPTDLPNGYKAYEDLLGNAGIVVVSLNRYKKSIGIEFSGILRPNQKLIEEENAKGLFYITEGKADQISWDEF